MEFDVSSPAVLPLAAASPLAVNQLAAASTLAHQPDLTEAYNRYRNFEEFVRPVGSPGPNSRLSTMNDFIGEWVARLNAALAMGCGYTDNVLAFKLLDRSNLDTLTVRSILTQLKVPAPLVPGVPPASLLVRVINCLKNLSSASLSSTSPPSIRQTLSRSPTSSPDRNSFPCEDEGAESSEVDVNDKLNPELYCEVVIKDGEEGEDGEDEEKEDGEEEEEEDCDRDERERGSLTQGEDGDADATGTVPESSDSKPSREPSPVLGRGARRKRKLDRDRHLPIKEETSSNTDKGASLLEDNSAENGRLEEEEEENGVQDGLVVGEEQDTILHCEICSVNFYHVENWSSHLRTHGLKPYPCTYCPKRFNAPSDLSRHMRSHTGERPFKCEVCGKGFSQAGGLSSHVRTHTGERPFHCDSCGKTFSRPFNYKRHLATHPWMVSE